MKKIFHSILLAVMATFPAFAQNLPEQPLEVYAKIAARFGIRSIPALVYYQSQKVVDQTVGVQTKAELEKRIIAMESNKN